MAETIIGESIVVDGEIEGEDPIVVEGTVRGKVVLDSAVSVATDGVVEADIESSEVEVSGQMNGNIDASERVEIKNEGHMVGDIRSPRVLIEDGANFRGNIDMDVE